MTMFRDIGERVGKNLNSTTWVKTVDGFGAITNRGSGPYSSLRTGKYDAEDSFRLVSYDSSLGTNGDWKKLTPIKDASNGKCAKAGAGT